MRHFTLIILILVFVQNLFAQNISQRDIPAVILNSFQLKYPNSVDVNWKKNNKNYQIDYHVNSKLHRLIMDFKGNILKHSQDLYISEVPEAVQKTILTRLDYFDMHDADKYEEDGKITYEIRFKKEGNNHFFWINEEGILLKYRRELSNNELPKIIVDFINANYGKIDVKRSKYVEENGKIIYIIRGKINENDHLFTINNKAQLQKHYKDLPNDEIPAPILKTIEETYKEFSIQDADLVEEGETTTYILKLQRSKKQIYINFNKDGKIL